MALAVAAGGVLLVGSAFLRDDATSRARPQPQAETGGPFRPEVAATIPVGSGPTGVAVGEGFVWVATYDPAGIDGDGWGVVKIDPETNQVVDAIPVQDATDVAAGAGAVWATSYQGKDGVIKRIDPRSGQVVATIPVGRSPSDVEVGLDAVWVTLNLPSREPAGEVVRIDPTTNAVVARVPVDEGWPRDVVIGEGAVWVYGHSKRSGGAWVASSLWRIDPVLNRLDGAVLDRNGFLGDGGYLPDNLAIGEGVVWAADEHGDAVRIDPSSGAVSTFHVRGGFSWPFAVFDERIFFGLHPVRILDSRTLELEGSLTFGSQVADAFLDSATSTLWVASYEDNVTRVDLLPDSASPEPAAFFKPAPGWSTVQAVVGPQEEQWPAAWAANVPFRDDPQRSGLPDETVRSLPPGGILMTVVGPRPYAGGEEFPARAFPLRLSDGLCTHRYYEGQPAPHVSVCYLDTWVGDRLLNVTVWLGRAAVSEKPSEELHSETDEELARLQIA